MKFGAILNLGIVSFFVEKECNTQEEFDAHCEFLTEIFEKQIQDIPNIGSLN